MKFLKSAFLLLFAITGFVFFSFAQDSVKQVQRSQSVSPGTPPAKGDAARDFDSHMAKFQQSYGKMKAQEKKVSDPKMRADMEALMTKMDKVNNDYNAMKNNSGLTEPQKQESRKRIESELKQVRIMREQFKTKYADQLGGKEKKPAEPKTPPEESEKYPE